MKPNNPKQKTGKISFAHETINNSNNKNNKNNKKNNDDYNAPWRLSPQKCGGVFWRLAISPPQQQLSTKSRGGDDARAA